MMSRGTKHVIEPLLGLLLLASTLSAQSASDTVASAHAGRRIANVQSTFGWFAGGVGGGFLLGPLGASLATGLAETRQTPLPADEQARLAGADEAYSEAFVRAYRERLRARRRRSALIGGVLGTVALGVLIYHGRETAPPAAAP